MPARLRSSVSRSSRLRSSERPPGSPTTPVAPPASGNGRWPASLEAAQAELADQVADVERVGGRIEADVHRRSVRTASGRRAPSRSVLSWIEATGLEVGEQVHAERNGTAAGSRASTTLRRCPRATAAPSAPASSCSPTSPRPATLRCTPISPPGSPRTRSSPACCSPRHHRSASRCCCSRRCTGCSSPNRRRRSPASTPTFPCPRTCPGRPQAQCDRRLSRVLRGAIRRARRAVVDAADTDQRDRAQRAVRPVVRRCSPPSAARSPTSTSAPVPGSTC